MINEIFTCAAKARTLQPTTSSVRSNPPNDVTELTRLDAKRAATKIWSTCPKICFRSSTRMMKTMKAIKRKKLEMAMKTGRSRQTMQT